jgi:hypothetical protein
VTLSSPFFSDDVVCLLPTLFGVLFQSPLHMQIPFYCTDTYINCFSFVCMPLQSIQYRVVYLLSSCTQHLWFVCVLCGRMYVSPKIVIGSALCTKTMEERMWLMCCKSCD